jgi:GT2 family glycosyltransferase
MSISVVIPTYRRPVDLRRCLESLQAQTVPPDEVLIIVRDTDECTREFLSSVSLEPLRIRVVDVGVPGQVAALNAGLESAECDIVAITDDDAAPRPDWLDGIQAHFARDSRVGGVGGRDWVHENGMVEDGNRSVVGKVQWFGRVIGNHHLGAGPARSVDVLKGANMSYRRAAIGSMRFDTRLRGTGAQCLNDMDFSLRMSRRNWTLIYDPAVAVDHYPAPRVDEGPRSGFNAVAKSDEAHNETFILLEHLTPIRRAVFLVWASLVGSVSRPGLVNFLRLLLTGRPHAFALWKASRSGRASGLRAFRANSQLRHAVLRNSETADIYEAPH